MKRAATGQEQTQTMLNIPKLQLAKNECNIRYKLVMLVDAQPCRASAFQNAATFHKFSDVCLTRVTAYVRQRGPEPCFTFTKMLPKTVWWRFHGII
jgi:hypothetical protein